MSGYDSHVVDAIDNALYDWDTSPDAMRWTPDPPLQPYPPMHGSLIIFDELHLVNVTALVRFMAAYQRAVRRVAEVLFTTVVVPALQRLAKAMEVAEPWDEHHPRPLCIDGHAYHQRRNRRRRR